MAGPRIRLLIGTSLAALLTLVNVALALAGDGTPPYPR
jgi:hypothetical protein